MTGWCVIQLTGDMAKNRIGDPLHRMAKEVNAVGVISYYEAVAQL